jgi:phosphate transport system substrate-binding protein
MVPVYVSASHQKGFLMLKSFVRRAGAAAFVLAMVSPALADTQLTGAGSTFDFPFFSKAFYSYSQANKDITVNYQSIGSGGGIEQFTNKTVDFGATDVPMTDAEVAKAGGGVLQVPVALGGEAITYNLPTLTKPLRLTRQNLVDIYLGKITTWNDAAIKNSNPGVDLPSIPVIPVNRSDGSGTNYIFTDFLAHVSPEFKTKVGVGKSVQWPGAASVGGKGNEGVAGAVKQSPGAIGYVELAYVIENKMPQAEIQNKSGAWSTCTPEHVKAAAATRPDVSAADFSIVDAAGAQSWPISGYSWVVIYQSPADKAKGKVTKDVLTWLATKGQAIAGTIDYVPLPENVQQTALRTLAKMSV